MQKAIVIVAKEAFDAVSSVMKTNESKGDAWIHQEVETHLAHARQHLHLLNRGDKSENHVMHAITRMAMAIAISNRGKKTFTQLQTQKKWSIDDAEVQS